MGKNKNNVSKNVLTAQELDARERERSRQLIEHNHGVKLAQARERQAEEIVQDQQRRITAAAQEPPVEVEGEPLSFSNHPAIYEERIWRSIKTTPRGLEAALNQLEQEGWQLVNIVGVGSLDVMVIGARVAKYALPLDEDAGVATEETASENAPDVTSDPDEEEKRKQWAAKQGTPIPDVQEDAPADEPSAQDSLSDVRALLDSVQ